MQTQKKTTFKLDFEEEERFSKQTDSKSMEMKRKKETERASCGQSRDGKGESGIR